MSPDRLATESDLELLAEEQVLEEETLALRKVPTSVTRRSPRSSIIGAGSPIAATSQG